MQFGIEPLKVSLVDRFRAYPTQRSPAGQAGQPAARTPCGASASDWRQGSASSIRAVMSMGRSPDAAIAATRSLRMLAQRLSRDHRSTPVRSVRAFADGGEVQRNVFRRLVHQLGVAVAPPTHISFSARRRAPDDCDPVKHGLQGNSGRGLGAGNQSSCGRSCGQATPAVRPVTARGRHSGRHIRSRWDVLIRRCFPDILEKCASTRL